MSPDPESRLVPVVAAAVAAGSSDQEDPPPLARERVLASASPRRTGVGERLGDGMTWPVRPAPRFPVRGRTVVVVPSWAGEMGGDGLAAALEGVVGSASKVEWVHPGEASAALESPEVGAVLWTAGLDGCFEVAADTDWGRLSTWPKAVFADADAVPLLAAVPGCAGIVAHRCPPFLAGETPRRWVEALLAFVADAAAAGTLSGLVPVDGLDGAVSGVLLGGRLDVLSRAVQERWLPAFGGAILLLRIPPHWSTGFVGGESGDSGVGGAAPRPVWEAEVAEAIARLTEAGVFDRHAAVVMGGFEHDGPIGHEIATRLANWLPPRLAARPVFAAPLLAGHDRKVFVFGGRSEIVAAAGGWTLRPLDPPRLG